MGMQFTSFRFCLVLDICSGELSTANITLEDVGAVRLRPSPPCTFIKPLGSLRWAVDDEGFGEYGISYVELLIRSSVDAWWGGLEPPSNFDRLVDFPLNVPFLREFVQVETCPFAIDQYHLHG